MPETAHPLRQDKRIQAIALMCAAAALFACNDMMAKWLGGQSIHPVMTTWARYASNMAILCVLLNPVGKPAVLRSNRLTLQLLRSFLLLLCTLLNFISLLYLQVTLTTSIIFGMPLLVALLAGPFLGEWAGPRRLAAIGVGFCGILIVTRPWSGSLHPATIVAFLGTITYALYVIVTRLLAAHDRSSTTTFYTGLAGLVLTTPALPFVWTTPQSASVWIMLAGIGLLATFGHWLLVLAHARAPAPILSPFIYTQIVWVAAGGYLVFGDVPDLSTITGAAIVIGSGLYLLWWEQAEKRRR